MVRKLSLQDKEDIAKEFYLETNVVIAVLNVESSGSGYNVDGTLKIQFEPYVFSKQLIKKNIAHSIKIVYVPQPHGDPLKEYEIIAKEATLTNGVQGQASEYEALRLAKKIDLQSALLSTSFGLGQIMGFNYSLAKYSSVIDMIASFNDSEANQLKGMLSFIKNNNQMFKALQSKDWAGFASLYNGSGYKEFKYDVRLKAAYDLLNGKVK